MKMKTFMKKIFHLAKKWQEIIEQNGNYLFQLLFCYVYKLNFLFFCFVFVLFSRYILELVSIRIIEFFG